VNLAIRNTNSINSIIPLGKDCGTDYMVQTTLTACPVLPEIHVHCKIREERRREGQSKRREGLCTTDLVLEHLIAVVIECLVALWEVF